MVFHMSYSIYWPNKIKNKWKLYFKTLQLDLLPTHDFNYCTYIRKQSISYYYIIYLNMILLLWTSRDCIRIRNLPLVRPVDPYNNKTLI